MAFGLYHAPRGRWEQAGYARVITDRTTFAYLADVFVLEAHRGCGLGVWLVETISAHAELHGLRRFVLATRDAHELYARFGFTPLREPARWMERVGQSSSSHV
jgi:GNAT superfamily N-acetyltransferase